MTVGPAFAGIVVVLETAVFLGLIEFVSKNWLCEAVDDDILVTGEMASLLPPLGMTVGPAMVAGMVAIFKGVAVG